MIYYFISTKYINTGNEDLSEYSGWESKYKSFIDQEIQLIQPNDNISLIMRK